MKYGLVLLVVLFAGCQSTPTTTADLAPSPAEYQPFREGDRMVYQFRTTFIGRPTEYRIKTQVVEKKDGYFAFVDEKGDYYLYSCDRQELQLHGERENGDIHTFTPPFIYLREGMIAGKTYETQNKSSKGEDLRCESRYVGKVEEKLPAGEFPDCVRAEFRYHLPTGQAFWIETTLAKGMGPIRKRFALESKEGKVLANFEQELVSYRIPGMTDAGSKTLRPENFLDKNASLEGKLQLVADRSTLQLQSIKNNSGEIAFSSPVFLLLPEMKENFPYRSTIKDKSGAKWDVVLFLKPTESSTNQAQLDLRIANKEKEFSWAIVLEEGKGAIVADCFTWDRQQLKPAFLENWSRDASKAEVSNAASKRSGFQTDTIGRALLRNAHDSRATWPASFKGYRAKIRFETEQLNQASSSEEGLVEVPIKGEAKVEGFQKESNAWLTREITSIVSHRRHAADSVGREPKGPFSIESGEPTGKIDLKLNGDPMDSSWTIEDGRVTRVRRKEIGGTFEIEVLAVEKDSQGRYAPTSYRVRHFAKDGALTQWEDYTDSYDWDKGFPIVRTRTIEEKDLQGNLKTRKKLSFDKIELLL